MRTDKERRDFIANEIKKRIVGPGLTSEVYDCAEDFSDEILDDRPSVLYTSGILFPKKSLVEPVDTIVDNGSFEEGDIVLQANNNVNFDDSNNNSNFKGHVDANQTDTSDVDYIREGYANHIGLLMCVDSAVNEVTVNISYGRYHHVSSVEVKDAVKVKLGRCSLEKLKQTFEYYDSCSSVTTNLALFGCKKMDDLFVIDENNLTISPKKIFKRNEDGKDKYLQATAFPHLLFNIQLDLFCKLLGNRGNEYVLGEEFWRHITWENFSDFINEIETNDVIRAFKQDIGIQNLQEIFVYDQQRNTISINRVINNIGNDIILNIRNLKIDDPVREYLLPLLLQYNYFKRRHVNVPSFPIDISEPCQNRNKELKEDNLKLYWKVALRNGKKYLKIQLQNIAEESQQDISKYCFQAKMQVESSHILPYTEPHASSIDDDEYTLNEELYRDVPMYAKGDNCSVEWSDVEGGCPSWISTTYTPHQYVKAFSSNTGKENTDNSCDIFNLTIWSNNTRDEILNSLTNIVTDYKNWMLKERGIAGGTAILQNVINEQEKFATRLEDNINYLRNNERAFECFKLANTAMYIQMCLARDEKFKKNRDVSEYNVHNFVSDAWEYFRANPQNFKYRPFQLAFLLMNVKSTFEQQDTYRKDNVDLIWFPTGGGKTEAYLALTALTVAERRTTPGDTDVNGMSVIMRYTLRLLTAQQFERASMLICALEYLRCKLQTRDEYQNYQWKLKGDKITIGMWIGSAQTPNKILDLTNYQVFPKYRSFFVESIDNGIVPQTNPFPISYCPWCGCKLINNTNPRNNGYDRNTGSLTCINEHCHFQSLPISYIDEKIYQNPPTLLFATVDKFAQLKSSNTGQIFSAERKPDLIIQDELHLISGPLGSLVGMFEIMVEELCTTKDVEGNVVSKPKIVTSTATTRNTATLVKQLYRRNVKVFPTSGVRYSDNFFSKLTNESKRMYMGLAPTGHSASELEINAIASELLVKEKMIVEYLQENKVDLSNKRDVYDAITINSVLKEDIDNYWTLVLYYMNLKSLSKTHSRLGDEILAKAQHLRTYTQWYPSLNFIIDDFANRSTEFTSRQESSKIKELLVEAESRVKLNCNDQISVEYNMDVVQATNMISVGIDIARWNVMFLIGQPLTTAEYIQSSSRVGRTTYGLVVNIYNTVRNRELSFYENYKSYHQAFYKFVEPLTVTTFTEATLDRLIYNLYFCYMSIIKLKQRPRDVKNDDLNNMKAFFIEQGSSIVGNSNIDRLIETKINGVHAMLTRDRFIDSTFQQLKEDVSKELMNSLRDIEPNTYIKFNL